MLEWPRYSVYERPEYMDLRGKIKNPGPGRPKTWAYPWCILNSQLHDDLISLDFGCGGWNNFVYHISEETHSLTVGVDTDNLQKDTGKVRFVKNEVDKLEFPTDFFDRIFSVSVLEHVPVASRSAVLNELFRVLRPGGLVVLTIDWVFGMTPKLLEQLSVSKWLGNIGSNIFGNFDFAAIINDYSHMVSPLESIDERYLPGSSSFDESFILADKDILVSVSDFVTDVDEFKYTTVGLILKKKGNNNI